MGDREYMHEGLQRLHKRSGRDVEIISYVGAEVFLPLCEYVCEIRDKTT